MDRTPNGIHPERSHPPPPPPPPPAQPLSSRGNTSVFQENGRVYATYGRGQYVFPVDEEELDRLDILHKFFSVARGDGLFSVPIHDPESPRAMDLGCGTGIWGIDAAERYPRGMFVGVDLNLIQPEFIPPNVRFVQQDVELEWKDLEPGSWDIVHCRNMMGSIKNWPAVYQEAHRHLRPYYGFVEHVEISWVPRTDDDTLAANSPLIRWSDALLNAMDRLGRPLRIDGALVKQQLKDAGFVDVHEEVVKVAMNGWPGTPHEREVGRWLNLNLAQGLQAMTLGPLYRGLNMDPADINALVNEVKAEMSSLRNHVYFTMHIFTARRQQ